MGIDINDLRSLVLVLVFIGFIGVWVWAWKKERKQDFEESARLPLEEDGALADNSKAGETR